MFGRKARRILELEQKVWDWQHTFEATLEERTATEKQRLLNALQTFSRG